MPLCLSVQGTAKTFERLSKPYKVINPYYLALHSNPDLMPSRPTLHFHIVYYTEGNLLSFYLAISRGIEPRSRERQSRIISHYTTRPYMIAIYVLMGNQSTRNLYYSLVAKDFTRLLCRYQPHDFFMVERISFTAVQVLGAEQKFYSKRSDIIL